VWLNSGVAAVGEDRQQIGKSSGGGRRPCGGRDDRWPNQPAAGREPEGGAIIAGNQEIGPTGRGLVPSGPIDLWPARCGAIAASCQHRRRAA
jgi:hypothetical protein